jgi:hypothetical protein
VFNTFDLPETASLKSCLLCLSTKDLDENIDDLWDGKGMWRTKDMPNTCQLNAKTLERPKCVTLIKLCDLIEWKNPKSKQSLDLISLLYSKLVVILFFFLFRERNAAKSCVQCRKNHRIESKSVPLNFLFNYLLNSTHF